jgi:outer membrane protein OmpA-like peptidoglycan-associated protein
MLVLSYDFSLSNNTQVWQRNGSTEITLGFRKKLQAKCKDTDKDGICDKDDECPNEFGLAEFKGCPDKDKDGIPDKNDECPDEFGLPEFNGCPDKDKDGIPDKKDDCPDDFGLVEFNGCPDKDKDGIPDKKDDCPDDFGLAQFNGCPDKDGDGIPDKDDTCPDEKGIARLQGCPEKEETKEEEKITKEEENLLEKASHVQFRSGESTILPTSYKILDEVVQLLKKHPKGGLHLEGHTDNVGNPARNLQLSKDRAASVRQYFINKGIDAQRITSEGFGQEKPKDNNTTQEGKANNRRVEMKFISTKK